MPLTRLPGLLVPGFVDCHVHYPQVDRIAAHGEQLLEWLERHIFPAEAGFADRAHADEAAAFFLDELLRHGTTSALVFATVHPQSVDALFEASLARNMRIISGKVLMDLGPTDLRDTAESGRAESEALIARWRGRGRLGYAVTPRFAPTSSDAQLTAARDLMHDHPDALLHTHLAENRLEIAGVAARFHDAADYLDVYDRFGLVGSRSVFAHGVHLEKRALGRMAECGAGIAFCPSSNLFLGSGLFDLARLASHGVAVGIGTDVGAGTSFSILETLGDAYKVCQLRGTSLDPFRALDLATAEARACLASATGSVRSRSVRRPTSSSSIPRQHHCWHDEQPEHRLPTVSSHFRFSATIAPSTQPTLPVASLMRGTAAVNSGGYQLR